MDLSSHRKTRFPAPDQTAGLQAPNKTVSTHRQTKFPGGTELQRNFILNKNASPVKETLDTEVKAALLSSRLPLRVNRPDAIPAKPLPTTTIKITPGAQAPTVRTESPWKTFTSLRILERGGQVIAACTQKHPVKMVAIKKLSSVSVTELAKFQHKNLLSIMELYRSGGEFFVITDYTTATLKQIIAIPLPLEELHVFDGMQHLSRFGLAHKKLDSSRVLFTSDGCAKIKSAAARSIGVIAMEMMQNGIPPESNAKFTLKHPERWSAEASNFLEVVSWGTLTDIAKNKFLKDVSQTVMIPFVEYARWDTIESLSIPNKEA
ncbi:hypothetical protein D0Z07_9210 [Hyphodiscus hymeniophilus]|uniref:Protein kinase domain-containing protein n=1 Tax=Hyphodiscus hymeniophilus TaxID=353542 RepID=A0A9P6SPX0_9HELO|nr:hypothetical protein D0Z07_9210 [Hyphodiscus hymeniophilus]